MVFLKKEVEEASGKGYIFLVSLKERRNLGWSILGD